MNCLLPVQDLSNTCSQLVYIFCLCEQIVALWKAKLVFSILNWYNLTSYRTEFTSPNIPNQFYLTKLVSWGIHQIYWRKFTIAKPQNQNHKKKFPKENVWYVGNQIFQTKSKSAKTKSTETESKVQPCFSCSWASSDASCYCQAQPKPQPANPQLGAEIALFSQLWGTTIHHTPYTQPGIVVLPVSSLIIPTVGTHSWLVDNLITTCLWLAYDLTMTFS